MAFGLWSIQMTNGSSKRMPPTSGSARAAAKSSSNLFSATRFRPKSRKGAL
jgi:hypothetical protein